MLVSQILRAKGDLVFTVSPDETLESAAAMLHARRVGAVVVLDAERSVVGILSERDVVGAVARHGVAGLKRTVSATMTRDVIFAQPEERVDQLMERMTDRRIRHLPVCQGGRLVGIVSIGDLVKWTISEVTAEADGLRAYIAAG